MAEMDNKLLNQLTEILKDIATSQKRPISEVVLTKNSINDIVKELLNGTYKFTQKTNKILSSDIGKSFQQVLKEQISQNNSFKGQIANQFGSLMHNAGSSKWWLGLDNTASGLQSMRRAEQIGTGFETLFKGNILSGLHTIFSAIPGFAKILGGPLAIGLNLVTRSLLKLDDALAKATKSAAGLTGGINSDYLNRSGFSAAAFNRSLKNNLYDLGMQGEYENISNALQKGYGMASYQGKQSDFITSMAYAQKGLGAYGISADNSNSLLSNLRLLEGKNTTGIYAQLNRLTKNITAMQYFSPEQAMQQMSSLFDQTKMLGTNFEWANKMIIKFEAELKKGTISLSDFAAVNKSLRSGSLSQNAGLGALITDYASRAGIALPENFVNSNALGQGFALTTESMLSNKNILAAYQGQLSEMVQQIGGSNKFEQAGALQAILQSRGINISAEAAEKAIKNDGTIDLESAGIIGKKAFENRKSEEQKAKDYQKQVETYYKGTTSWHKNVLTKMDKLINNTMSSFERGAAGEVTGEGKWYQVASEAIGYSLTEGLWKGLGEILEKIGKQYEPGNPNRIT